MSSYKNIPLPKGVNGLYLPSTLKRGQDIRPAIMGVTISFFVVNFVVVSLRMYCRLFLVRRFGWDDKLMVIALMVMCAVVGLNMGQVKYGAGLGLDQFDMSTFSQYLKLWYTYQITYVCLHFFIKTSILFFLYALSRSKPYRIGIYILGTLITLYTISMVFVSIFECNPIHHAWDPLKFGTDCIYLPTLYYTQASFNLATDVALLAYPLPTLIALRLPTPKKLMLIGIFSVGSLTILASILRFFAIRDLSNPANDTNIASGLILVWSEVEANIGMIAASAPALQPLVKRALVGNVRGEGYPGTTREGMSRDSTTFFSGAPRSRDTIDSSAPGSSSEPKPPLSSMPLSRLSAALRGSTTSFPGKVETTISSDAPPLPSPGFTPHTPPGPYGFGSGGSAGYGTSEEEVGWERGIMKSTRVVVSYDDDEEKGGLSARRV